MSDEVERIKQKANDGAVNVVKKILDQPEVQNAIKTNIAKQTLVSGLFMSFFLVGFFMLFNVAKAVINYDWMGDLIIGVVLIFVGGIWMLRQLKPVKGVE